MSPAEFVINKFGGVRPASRLLNISHSAVSQWKSFGTIPAKRHLHILKIAKENKIKITPQNLIYGDNKKG